MFHTPWLGIEPYACIRIDSGSARTAFASSNEQRYSAHHYILMVLQGNGTYAVVFTDAEMSKLRFIYQYFRSTVSYRVASDAMGIMQAINRQSSMH